MTPRDKAEKLFSYHFYYVRNEKDKRYIAIQCALITVDEIIQQCWDYRDIDLEASYDYWQQVKQELQML